MAKANCELHSGKCAQCTTLLHKLATSMFWTNEIYVYSGLFGSRLGVGSAHYADSLNRFTVHSSETCSTNRVAANVGKSIGSLCKAISLRHLAAFIYHSESSLKRALKESKVKALILDATRFLFRQAITWNSDEFSIDYL